LDALAGRGFAPLVRTARRGLFGSLSGQGAGAASELERECAARGESGVGGVAYAPGDLFCDGDCMFALVFGQDSEGGALTASVIYDLETAAPLGRLERFCREVRAALEALKEDEGTAVVRSSDALREASDSSASAELSEASSELPQWQPRAARLPQGLARFMAIQPAEFVRAGAALRGGRELARASEMLEERAVRDFLRRMQELRIEGYTPRRLLAEAGASRTVSVERMLEAGLLERELRVSCRKSGHALFDLPSPDSLAAVTVSRAKCSLCAAPVADEVIEETFSPTRLAVALLDGGWLANRVYRIVRSLGVPESDIATGPPGAGGESYLAADVCGTSFIVVTRDGDLTPAFSRRVAEIVEETDAEHLIAVVTGSAEDEGRLRLYEFAWRRARGGRDLATTVVEGLDAARAAVGSAFEAAVRRELSRSLFSLDSALGFAAAGFVLDWFRTSKASAARARQTGERAAALLMTG
ncbi:MAG TPA: hypothetical protein VNZ44_03315, partial [Pyrinomonadaceae bacterium]|nr:hypothetical protein [Pyrinomonadaceae bacterium]